MTLISTVHLHITNIKTYVHISVSLLADVYHFQQYFFSDV